MDMKALKKRKLTLKYQHLLCCGKSKQKIFYSLLSEQTLTPTGVGARGGSALIYSLLIFKKHALKRCDRRALLWALLQHERGRLWPAENAFLCVPRFLKVKTGLL